MKAILEEAAVVTNSITQVLGPIIGGFVSESIGWRWTFWIITIIVSNHLPVSLISSNKSLRRQSSSSHQSSSSARPTLPSYSNGKLPASAKKQATPTSYPKWTASSLLANYSSAPSADQPSSSSYHPSSFFYPYSAPSSSASSLSSSPRSPQYSSNNTTSPPAFPASPISVLALAWPCPS